MNAKFLCAEWLILEYLDGAFCHYKYYEITIVVLLTALVMMLYKGFTGKKLI